LVTRLEEWKHLRRIHDIRLGIGDTAICPRSDGAFEIYLLANETFSIPFIYQSFLGSASSAETPTAGRAISLLNSKKVPVAMLDVTIIPQHHWVDRSLRYFRPESEVFRKTVRCSPSITACDPPTSGWSSSTEYDMTAPGKRYMRCSDPEVICTLVESAVIFSNWHSEIMRQLGDSWENAKFPLIHGVVF
ncbi:hypothetical protein BDK51DRAFT_32172, partial [Blyttiomyces helicus]